MNTRMTAALHLPLAMVMTVASGMIAQPVEAGTYAPSTAIENPAPTQWMWGISADYMLRSVDRSEDYLSAPYDWHVDYRDFDGDLWGLSAFVTFPSLWNMTLDFAYRTGDLEGRFTNYSLDPADPDFGNIYNGDARFDRDEFVVGISYPFPSVSWLYARLEWFYFDEEGDWIYPGGFIESQEYTLWGLSAGLGAKHSIPLGGTGATLDLNAFAGLVYFDFEHTEVAGGAETSWEDWGFLGRIGASFNYPIHDQYAVFLGTGYEYLVTDDGGLDMDNDGFFVNLGIKGRF